MNINSTTIPRNHSTVGNQFLSETKNELNSIILKNIFMKKFVRFLMWLLFVFALFIMSAYLLPQHARIERRAEIEASPKIIFSQVNDLYNWEKWSKWHILDPDLKTEFNNNGVGQGAGVIWNSNNEDIGVGKLTITESVPYDSIFCVLQFPEKNSGAMKFLLVETGEQTMITWTLTLDVGYNPFARWGGLLKNRTIGPDLEDGLDYLNTVCKVLEQEDAMIVELEQLDAFDYAAIREKVSFNDVSSRMSEMYQTIAGFVAGTTTSISGAPFAIYHEMKNDTIDLECGYPISELILPEEPIQTGTFQTAECAVIDYFGNYGELEEAHSVIQQWIEKHRFRMAGPPIEKYLTDAATEADSEKWHTKIYYPVR
jgi:effector-binding domain-containing protein